jgi:hypothetical protein
MCVGGGDGIVRGSCNSCCGGKKDSYSGDDGGSNAHTLSFTAAEPNEH